jgi:hypothetical protein
MVRMIKAEEDAYQSMGEEASNHAFTTATFLIAASDEPEALSSDIDTVISAYSIYDDEYLNRLVTSNIKEIFDRFFQPVRRFAIRCNLV